MASLYERRKRKSLPLVLQASMGNISIWRCLHKMWQVQRQYLVLKMITIEARKDNKLIFRKTIPADVLSLPDSLLVGKPLSEWRRAAVLSTLDLTNGHKIKAAKILGIGERTLYRYISQMALFEKGD